MRTRLSLPALLLFFVAASCSKEKTCAADERVCRVQGADVCVALQSDPFHCGTCGNACGPTQGCSSGTCVDCTATGGCVAEVLAACFNLNQVRPLAANLALAGAPLPTDSGPISFAAIGDKRYVANNSSDSISAITVSPPSSTSGTAAIQLPAGNAGFSDLQHLAAHGGLLWASNAAAGTLVAVDPSLGAPVDEITLGASTEFMNPQGLDFVGTKGYLALAGVNALAVLDLSTVPGARVLKRIDLAPLAAAGATAGPSRVVAVDSRVYVTLTDLDASFQVVPGANGRLAVVDATTDSLVGGAIDLGPSCLDASGLALSGTTLWVACGFHAFNSNAVSGASLVPVELANGTPVVGTPVVLSNAATSIAFCGGRGYAGASESGTVLSFDPVSRTVTSALVCPVDPGKASFVPDIACAR